MTCEAWPIAWPCEVPPTASDAQQSAAQQAAQSILWGLTGRRLGVCEHVEQYTPVGTGECGMPYMTDDRAWHNNGRVGAMCCAIVLLQQPVQSVSEVRVRGQVIASSSYRVDGVRLVRLDGCWPAVDECGPPPVQVTYTAGVPISPDLWGLVSLAMGEVANELVQAACGGQCRLPSTATSVTRQGVSVGFAAPLDLGMTGMPLTDRLILAVNPRRKQARSRVFSSDMARGTRVTSATSATNVGGVSTLILPDAYEGDPYSWTVTFPDASFLAGSPADVDAEIKVDPDGATVATWTATVAGAVLTLALLPVTLAPGSYWTDVSVGGVTYIRKTRLVVRQQVSS